MVFNDEEFARYFISQSASKRLRRALVLTAEQAIQRLPLLPTFNRMLLLTSYEMIDAIPSDDSEIRALPKPVQSPWWNARKKRETGRVVTLPVS